MLEKKSTHDRRKVKTQNALKNALIAILGEKDFQAITVQHIADRADINRATFYAHYADKYDLLQRLVDDMLQQFEAIFVQHFATYTEKPHSYELHVAILEHMKDNAHFYKVMLSHKGLSGFWRRLLDIVYHCTGRRIEQFRSKDSKPYVPTGIVNSYIASAYIGVIIHWLEEGMPYTPEYLAEKITYLTELRRKEKE